MAVAAAAVGAAILLVVAVPRIPPLWSIVWNTWDFVEGGVEDRDKTLRDHPFPAALAPPGYRIDGNEETCYSGVDPAAEEVCHGWSVSFAGPDDVDKITFDPRAATADEVYDRERRLAEFDRHEFLSVEDLGADSFCEQGDDVFHESHVVSCVASFDGMAVIADSENRKPQRGSLEHALTLLRAGVAHWESIRD